MKKQLKALAAVRTRVATPHKSVGMFWSDSKFKHCEMQER